MKFSRFLLVILLLTPIFTDCQYKDYNFNSLDQNLWHIQTPSQGDGYVYDYFFRLCSPLIDADFENSEDCKCCLFEVWSYTNPMGIQVDQYPNHTDYFCRTMGVQNPPVWGESNGLPYVIYSGGYYDRRMKIQFVCDENANGYVKSVSESKDTSTIYTLQLATNIVCEESSKKLSGGWVFIIIITAGTVLYCGIGIPYKKFAKHETGKNILPNSGFWSSLPGLISDGFKYVFSGCKKKNATYETI
ncbi:hypothetical protein M0811_04300 [Anaeramoeba ignava]|uniref:Autophagy-related protein 27 n=1 Tax=Anaeramoeba ignava TaxID=1746090 RepID=A0A9Q0LVH0_ANAIG|nr:hypothetical protein M0811_04300 [Anaeramoeba ignava]|eukprot:Anaeramoba_ignava/a8322_113.p1 GENE.a8322_113~~a8322_113.p1  ORF type:complete len:261 (+),score=62.96 a8322_113:50-784(+)